MERFQVAVLGGGPGGYVAAIRAAQLGNKVVIVERDKLGGTCLNRGCIPAKALLHSAHAYEQIVHAANLGICAENVNFDYMKFTKNKDKIITRLVGGVGYLLKSNNVTVVYGEGLLKDQHTITVGDREIYTDYIILATGSRPAGIKLPGIDKPGVMDSDGVLELKECPESIVIIGGGIIGIEFATLFSTLDKKVTVIEMLPGIMGPAMDAEVSTSMTRILKKKGVGIHLNSKVTGIQDGLTVVYEEEGRTCEAKGQIVLTAVGRTPVTAGLGFETVGVRLDKRGFVDVNDSMRTSVPNIFAVGDITGKIQLAHVASAQGLVSAHNTCGGNKQMRYDIIPTCVYTNPEVACIGLSEAQAKEKGFSVRIGQFTTASNSRSMMMGITDGFAKIVTDDKTGHILGAQLMCENATEMIAEIAVAMKAQVNIEVLADIIHPHPTVSEAVMEAAHDVLGLSCHKV